MDVSCEGPDDHALTFVHYMSGDAIHEDMFCLKIPEYETAQGMFSVLRGYIEKENRFNGI
jgi:hypothetical protein